ncbi:MAG TPA: ATP-binding cassette domain-containing protein [Bacteroidetes bacterium]|nr:ATP-binding cassette domain-containing protein [Bacteroidota bacterium]
MREPVLFALIHIFAILSQVTPGGITTRGRKILRGYLARYLNQELEEEYYKIFETTHEFYSEELSGLDDKELKDETSLINFQIKNICRQIRKGLFLEERMIVFLQLLEFVYEDREVTSQERKIIEIVARTFNINEKEYNNSCSFMIGNAMDKVSPDSIILIEGPGDEEKFSDTFGNKKKWNKIPIQGLQGSIFVLHIESIHILLFTYHGNQSLYFRGKPVIKGRPYLLDPGVSIKGKDIEPIYYAGILREFLRLSYVDKIIFEGHNLEYRFKKSDQGLKPMSFRADSGNLIGIMGGSGVGKSTMLNILNGKMNPDRGNLYLNGYDLFNESDELKGLIGYIPQDDLLIEELTVFQNLYYNARLCFGNYSRKRIRTMVKKILKGLELYEIKDLQVGDPLNKKISGGQRKRLNISLELIREPAILFVDEPTSGLSSSDSHKVMELLKEQANKGKLIISIIHQPSSGVLKLFDRLWILDKGGYMVYDGDPVDSLVYFKTETSQANAAESECPNCGNVDTDDILDLIESKQVTEEGYKSEKRVVEPKEWYERYKRTMKPNFKSRPQKFKLPQTNFSVPSKISQLKTFFKRNILRKLSDRQYLTINLFEAPMLAVILAFLSKYITDGVYLMSENKNLPIFLFMAVVVALFLGLTVSAEEIFKDRKILERQKFLDISRSSYLVSKISFLFMLSALQSFLFIFISDIILEINGLLFRQWLVLFSISCFGNIVGLNISAGMRSVVSIYILIPLILVPQLLLGGAMIKFDDLHKSFTNKIYVPIIGDVMATRWAYEAISVDQFKNNRYERLIFDNEMNLSQNDWYDSFLIPELKKKVKECEFAKGRAEYASHFNNNLNKLNRYIGLLSSLSGIESDSLLSELNVGKFDSATVKRANARLDSLRSFFRAKRIDATSRRDSILNELEKKIGREKILELKRNNYNNYLADIVLNVSSIDKIYETEDQMIQKSDPVYMAPTSRIGRAHFFAPFKYFGNLKIDTLWFNIMAIWLMSAAFMLSLYFNVLKKIIDLLESISFSWRKREPRV